VRAAAALAGGITAGVLWSVAAWVYSWYARTAVYYTDVYGSLSAIPLFVFWVWLSWFIVLLGAVVGFAWQNLATYRQEMLAPEASPSARELLALRVMVEATRRFIDAAPPARAEELAPLLHASGRLVNETVDRLTGIGWLLAVGEARELVPDRDPTRLRAVELLGALRGEGRDAIWGRDPATRKLEALRANEWEAAAGVWGDITLADLATATAEGADVRQRRARS
jgi:membrane protein